jgi:hypothetical protein
MNVVARPGRAGAPGGPPPAGARRGPLGRRQVGDERLELGPRRRGVGGVEALGELLEAEPALAGGLAQTSGRALALVVGGARHARKALRPG